MRYVFDINSIKNLPQEPVPFIKIDLGKNNEKLTKNDVTTEVYV